MSQALSHSEHRGANKVWTPTASKDAFPERDTSCGARPSADPGTRLDPEHGHGPTEPTWPPTRHSIHPISLTSLSLLAAHRQDGGMYEVLVGIRLLRLANHYLTLPHCALMASIGLRCLGHLALAGLLGRAPGGHVPLTTHVPAPSRTLSRLPASTRPSIAANGTWQLPLAAPSPRGLHLRHVRSPRVPAAQASSGTRGRLDIPSPSRHSLALPRPVRVVRTYE